mgnify:CR=1 FL=1
MVTLLNPSYYSLMNHEIELKLRLNTRELPLLEKALASHQFISEPTLQLLNRYFDTPSMALSQGGAALRIRQQSRVDTPTQPPEIIQTLKTRGTSSGGLHQRMEWDWPLDKVDLDLALIQNGDAQNYLAVDIDLNQIEALFTTDFQRKVWLFKDKETVIELVLDQGQVSTDQRHVDLLELELELKAGDEEVLFQLAENIAQQCPVLMSDISKAERGYGLLALSDKFQGIKKDWQGKVPSFDPEQNVIATVKTFFAYQLSVWQRSLELSIWDGKIDLQKQGLRQITQLQQLLAIFSSIDCLPEVQLLQRQLQQAENAHWQISLIWGQVCIACGHWLHSLENDNSVLSMSDEELHAMQLHIKELAK